MTIEHATDQDIPALIGLLDVLFTIEQDFHPDRARQQRGLELLLRNAATAAVLVAQDEAGDVIGMVTAQLVISTAEGAPSAWIEDLVVVAEHRGRGVGRELLQAIIDWAQQRGATRAQLLCDLDNAPAIGFYDRVGWQATRLNARRMQLPGMP